MSVRVRYAPSPTGSPHVGNVRTALYNWLFARKEGGTFLVRLEDTDRTPGRYVPEGIYDIEASLRFLGTLPDEWWVSGGPNAPYVQSQRLDSYRAAAERMIAEGSAYRCYCSRERLDSMRAEQVLRGEPTGYDRHCRTPESREKMRLERLEKEGAEPAFVVRLAMPLEGVTILHDVVRGEISYENRLQDDQVLLKSDGFPTYFLAAAVDDNATGITHIIRGDDWLSSAPKLVQVFKALGCEPPMFVHPPLIVGADGKKLSKRHGATQFNWFMEQGYLPEAMFNFLVLLGWSPGLENQELFSIPELIERFSLKGMSQHPAVFDYEKLKWMNGYYIRHSEPGRIIGMCLPYLRRAGLIPDPPGPDAKDCEKEEYRIGVLDYARRIILLEIDRMKVLSEVTDLVGFFFKDLNYPDGYDEKALAKWMSVPHLKPMLAAEIEAFELLTDWNTAAIESVVRSISESLAIKFGDVIHPTRVAATGQAVGPGLFETLWALGRDRTVGRLRTVMQRT
jgi:glutamyl-tRNA synthetase